MSNPSTSTETIVVTGANGQLGRLVLAELQRLAPSARRIGLVRDLDTAQDVRAFGVELRKADYDAPETLASALAGVDKLLLISSSEVGQRVAQHRNVIAAAKAAGVRLLAYTSILHADTSPLTLALEHRATEAEIRASGIPFVLLRNGWYTENYTVGAADSVQNGVVIGGAGDGRLSLATRADYAAAAATVLAGDPAIHAGTVHELAGDEGCTLSDYAAELARQSGKPVVYRNLAEAEYREALKGFGLPTPLAAIIADSDAKTASGALHDSGRALSRLIGRPTTPLKDAVAVSLAGRETGS